MAASDALLARGMTPSDQLARHARKIPDSWAVRFNGTGRTYRELDERVCRLAGALRARGVGDGDRVAILGLNSVELIEAFLACVRLGAIGVPINFRLVAPEVGYALADSGAVAAVLDSSFTPLLDAARAHAPGLATCLVIDRGESTASANHADCAHADSAHADCAHADCAHEGSAHEGSAHEGSAHGGSAHGGYEDYEQALAGADPEFDAPQIADHTPAFIMYTSGTTGRPKGAVLTHYNLMLHAFSSNMHMGVHNDDRVSLSGAPLFHIAGLSGYLMSLLPGGTFVITPSGGFDPAATVALLATERVTTCFFVPSQWQAICAVPDLADHDLSALRRLSWGAAPASTALLRTMMATFPQAEVVTAFGQTECSPVTCYLRGEDSIRKIGSIGTPMLNVEVRVVDEHMNDVPQGQIGEIVYRGPMVMKQYWNKPTETEAAFAGGWFHSGDLVREDEDGYYYVVDRKKDMIISGGENIYCAEVENILAGHPKIADIALIGIPDPRWGETPLAVLVPTNPTDPPTTEDIQQFCRANLASYKCPKAIAVVTELPRNASGKILKTQLRTAHAANELISAPAV